MNFQYHSDEFFRLIDPSPSFDSSKFSMLWEDLFTKIINETGGKILFGGGIGSRLYNLSEKSSDIDIFVVYQANPKTYMNYKLQIDFFKSKDNHNPDYTVYELSTFCQLLLNGDTKAIELILVANDNNIKNDPSLIYYVSELFNEKIVSECKRFLNIPKIVKKYLSEFNGVKGLKKLQSMNEYLKNLKEKQEKTNLEEINQLEERIQKGLYINHRLLYQSRLALSQLDIFPPFPSELETDRLNHFNIAHTQPFTCYFKEDTDIRENLLNIRRNKFNCSVEGHFSFLEQEYQNLISSLHDDENLHPSNDNFVENSIDEMRISYFNEIYSNIDCKNVNNNISKVQSIFNDFPCSIPGFLLVAYKNNNKKEGIYFPFLSLRFSNSYSPIISGNGWTIYEIGKWMDQLEKGNPNIVEFLVNVCVFECEKYEHDQWKIFIKQFSNIILTSTSLHNTHTSIIQAAKKLDRGKISKRKWKTTKQPPKPLNELSFPDDKLQYSNILRFFYEFIHKNKEKEEFISFDKISILDKSNLELSEIIIFFQNNEEIWRSILPRKLLDNKDQIDLFSTWSIETYVKFLSD